MDKKLTLSKSDKKIFGVCGGIAEYFDVDSSLIRVAWILASCFGGLGILAYLACALIIPKPEN